MAKIRIRFEMNKGRTGAPLAKLGRIAEQAERFLSLLATDCQLETKPSEWLAVNFRNGSVSYDAEFQGEVTPAAAEIYAKSLLFVTDYDPDREGSNGTVNARTLLEYARIGKLIDPDEIIGVGVYHPDSPRPKWRRINYQKSSRIVTELEAPLPGYGSIQGIIHAWFKESREPYLNVRELSTENIIRCRYASSLYANVASMVQERNTILIATGDVWYDRALRTPTDMRADRIDAVNILSDSEFDALFGSAPGFTGDESTTQFMMRVREDV